MPALLLLLTALEHDELDVDGLERRPAVDDARRLARGGGRGHREGVWFRFSKEENVTTSHFSRRFFSFGVFESQEKKRSVFLSLFVLFRFFHSNMVNQETLDRIVLQYLEKRK